MAMATPSTFVRRLGSSRDWDQLRRRGGASVVFAAKGLGSAKKAPEETYFFVHVCRWHYRSPLVKLATNTA
jgi:hypothetical protein